MNPLGPVRWIDDDGMHAPEVMHADAEALDLSVVAAGDVVGVQRTAPRATWTTIVALAQRSAVAFPVGMREPAARVASLLAQAGARGLLTDGGMAIGATGSTLADGCTVLATSGTTGHPKCVVHDLAAHADAARVQGAYLRLTAEDRWLLSLPLHHVGGFAIVARMAAAQATVIDVGAAGFAHALDRHAPTHVSLVPTQLRRLLREPASVEALRACRAVLLGGGPASAALRQAALDAGVPLVATYGMTETLAFVAASADPAVVARGDSAGTVLPGRTVLVEKDGALAITSPTLFAGTLVQGAFHPRGSGPFRTGDVGALDDAGILHIAGRRDRMFVSGGENVHPEEIERALCALPEVDAAVVLAVAHEEFGMRPVACVAGRALRRSVLATALRATLAGFKVPDAWYVLPQQAPTAAALHAQLRDDPDALPRLRD